MAKYQSGRKQDIVADQLQRFSQMQVQRNLFSTQCEEIASLIWPEQRNTFFYGSFNWQGIKQTARQIDATGMRALHHATAIYDSLLTPQHAVWSQIAADDPYVMKDKASREWFEAVSQILWRQRYKALAGFVGQNSACWQTQIAFGTDHLFIDALDGRQWNERGLRYKALPWGETYIVENHQGLVDGFVRAFRMTARQIYQRWPDEFPEQFRGALEARSEVPFMILHCVGPRDDYDPDSLSTMRHPWYSYYLAADAACLLQEGGYRTMPRVGGRYQQAPGEVYGRSIAMIALPSLKLINAQKTTVIKTAHRAADPVLLTPETGLVDVSLMPGALNPGGWSPDGHPMIGTLPSGNVQITEEMMQKEEQIIDDLFMTSLFKLAEQTREMSAREVVERIQERGVIVAPHLGRQLADRVDPQVERELDVLSFQSLLPPQPGRLREAGGSYRLINTSPLARAMQSQSIAGFMRTIEIMNAVAQNSGDRSVYSYVSFKRALPEIARDQFVPESWMATDEEVQQAAQAAEAAQEREWKIKEAAPKAAEMKAMAVMQKAQAGQNMGNPLSGTPEGGMPPV